MGLTKRGDIWWMAKSVNGQQVRKTTKCTNKQLAEIAYGEWIKKIEQGEVGVEEHQIIKFNDYADQYVKDPTMKNDANDCKKRLVILRPYFGEMFMHQITKNMVLDYISWRLKGDEEHKKVKKSTVNRERSHLLCIFTKAVKDKCCKENPMEDIPRFDERPFARDRILSDEEREHFFKFCTQKLIDALLILNFGGYRSAEQKRMQWHQINFDKNCITVRKTKSGEPKYVPMLKVVRDVLLRLKAQRTGNSPFVFPGNCKDGYYDWWGAFKTARKNSKIKNFVPHDLRHTFCTMMAEAGYSIQEIMQFSGHATTQMLERYTHITERHLQKKVLANDPSSTILAQFTESDKAAEFNKIVSSIELDS